MVDWTQLGAAAGAVAVVFLFSRIIAMFFRDRREDRKIWENHLSQVVLILQAMQIDQTSHRRNTEK